MSQNHTYQNLTKTYEHDFSSPVKWRVMFAGILGMIFCAAFVGFSGAAFALDSTANFSVVVPTVNALEITLSDSNLILNLTPQMAEASFGSKDLTITVGTSNPAGYNLMMNTSSTDLTSDEDNIIASLEENEDGYTCTDAACDFTLNRWGFKRGSETVYNYVPVSVSLASNDAPTNGEATTVNFASRVDAQQPAGTYSTTLTFVATVNPNIPSCNPSVTTIAEAVCLQDLKGDNGFTIANSMTSNEVYSLYDNRDYEQYDVAKLADGNVWFLDNLRLDPTVITLNPDNSNVTGTVVTTFTNKTSGWSGDDAYTNAWYNLDSKDVELSYGSGVTKVGGYYNFCAASAGSYCYSSSAATGNASQDLCPAGWRMPTGGTGGEYAALAQAITGVSGDLGGANRSTFMEAAHFSPSGRFSVASAEYQGNSGALWSSTLYNADAMYYLALESNAVYPTSYANRVPGRPIRCILRAGTEMQGATTSALANKLKNVNDVTTLVDTRDYQPYTVAKLADNKIWMTKNLNLPGGTEIESTKSDVPANYPLPTANGFGSGNTLPASSSASAGFDDDTKAFVVNSGSTTCASNSPCYSYYSWTTATAGSGLSITNDSTNAEYSICPKGWKLPNTLSGNGPASANYDFRALIIAYGGSYSASSYANSTTPTGAAIYGKITTSPTPGFLLTGYYVSGSFARGGSYGYYWSSTPYYGSKARSLTFYSTYVESSDNSHGRREGLAIRCLLAD